MAKASSRNRFVLQLDPRIALEAIILNRLERIPKARRQEWLRGLLVQGFHQECKTLRGIADGREQPPAMAFTPTRESSMKGLASTSMTAPLVQSPDAGKSDKPFAALGKVIG